MFTTKLEWKNVYYIFSLSRTEAVLLLKFDTTFIFNAFVYIYIYSWFLIIASFFTGLHFSPSLFHFITIISYIWKISNNLEKKKTSLHVKNSTSRFKFSRANPRVTWQSIVSIPRVQSVSHARCNVFTWMNMTKGIDPVVTCGTSLDRRKLSTRAGVPILFRGRGGTRRWRKFGDDY